MARMPVYILLLRQYFKYKEGHNKNNNNKKWRVGELLTSEADC